jgi:excisionase family DNA binding protein
MARPSTSAKNRDHDDADSPAWGIRQTARYLGVNRATVYVMIADGRLPAYRLGNRIIRLRKSDIDAALERM